jgi:16S rRNA C1402 N4-methylase RsmH
MANTHRKRRTQLPNAVETAHALLQQHLQPQMIAIDATAGNGHDTLFLCQTVTELGQVYAFDIQNQAIINTQQRLQAANISPLSYHLISSSHDLMIEELTLHQVTQVDAVLFNLGYLPGTDKQITTQTSTTLKALDQACILLKPQGLLCVVVYPGHSEGLQEQTQIEQWCQRLHPFHFEVQLTRTFNRLQPPPELWAIVKKPNIPS